eukprot:4292971-Prorocentrum_lima.AAC.1
MCVPLRLTLRAARVGSSGLRTIEEEEVGDADDEIGYITHETTKKCATTCNLVEDLGPEEQRPNKT